MFMIQKLNPLIFNNSLSFLDKSDSSAIMKIVFELGGTMLLAFTFFKQRMEEE